MVAPGKQGQVRQPQMVKQQPIGQPMGDIPLISQYFSFKNKGTEGDKAPIPNTTTQTKQKSLHIK